MTILTNQDVLNQEAVIANLKVTAAQANAAVNAATAQLVIINATIASQNAAAAAATTTTTGS